MSWEWDKTLTINLKPKTTAELKENIKNGTTVLFANVEKLTKELKKIKENTKLSSVEKQEKVSEIQKEIKDCKEEIDFFQKILANGIKN